MYSSVRFGRAQTTIVNIPNPKTAVEESKDGHIHRKEALQAGIRAFHVANPKTGAESGKEPATRSLIPPRQGKEGRKEEAHLGLEETVPRMKR